MQILNRQLLSTTAGDVMKMTSPAFSHPDCQATGLPCAAGSHFISMENDFLQSNELFSCMQWASCLSQSAPREECVYADDIESAGAGTISIAGLAVDDASDVISFFKECDIERGAGARFSVEVPESDCGLVIDAGLAAIFGITVTGMDCPHDTVPDSGNSMALIDQRRIRQRLNVGRMICLLKQQLNL